MALPSHFSMSQLCEHFASLGQTQSSVIQRSVSLITDKDESDSQDNVGDPDFYDVNYVPLPQILPCNDGQTSRFSEFRTSFYRPPRLVNGKSVQSCGVSMLECLQGTSEMIEGDTRLHSGWGEKSAGMINVTIAWPGYDAHSVAEICVYEPLDGGRARQRITRSELAKRIAMHYLVFFDFLTLNESYAQHGEVCQADGIGQDPLWKVGFRGYMFDRLHIMSVSQTFDNFCKVEICVLTAKGFPTTVMYP